VVEVDGGGGKGEGWREEREDGKEEEADSGRDDGGSGGGSGGGGTSGAGRAYRVKVHFDRFASKWDEWYDVTNWDNGNCITFSD
jgi:hypothetical protein